MGTRQSGFERVWQNDSTLRFTVAGLVGAAGISFWLDATMLLFGLAVLSPVILMLFTAPLGQRFRFDTQTGLLDQDSLTGFLDQALEGTDDISPTACIVFQVDDLDRIERDMGAMASSDIRAQLADRLSACLRRDDRIAYLGGDEFAVALFRLRRPELGGVLSLIERVQTGCSAPIEIDATSIHVTLSAGFCLAGKAPAQTGASLIQSAQMALKEACRHAPSGVRAYSARTPQIVGHAITGSTEVLEALNSGQIIPWFQPQISTDTGLVTGFEALARWDHPERGIISPAEFLPALVASQKMEVLSETMLDQSLKAIHSWDRAGLSVPSVAVNFSTQELRNPGLTARIKWDVDRYDLDPDRLTVEILETVVSHSDEDVITRNIRALHTQGFRIDLDDFGTGHASLANIRRFSVDRIKIDRSFVTHADDDPEQQRMIAAIVGMAEQLGIETLAEGVETIGEQSILSQLGCTHIQGFCVAKPMPFSETQDWIVWHHSKLNRTPQLPRRKSAG